MEIVPVTPERWDDLVDLFTRRGPRGGGGVGQWCWCMWWRQRQKSAAANRRALQAIVEDGGEPGLLAYAEGDPVGWVSVAPREDYGHLSRSKHYGPTRPDEGVWSIACFIVHPNARHRGVAKALLEGSGRACRRQRR